MKKVIFISLALLFIFSSCKKDDKSCGKTTADIAGTYTLVKVEVGSGGSYNDVTNDNNYVEPCQKDDKLILNANGTAQYVDEGTVCSPSESATGTWSVSSDGKFTVAAGPQEFSGAEIVSFDCKNLVISAVFSFGGFSANIKTTLKKM